MLFLFLFFKQKTAYEMRISDWSSDVCSSDLSTAPVWPAGNSTRQRDDNPLMDCELIREGLSAFLDDEDAGISKTELDAHVSGCVGCSAWWARAMSLAPVTGRSCAGAVRGRSRRFLVSAPQASARLRGTRAA